jgi:hypothetical protein
MKKIFILLLIIMLGVMIYRDFYKGKPGAKFDFNSVVAGFKKRAADIRTSGGQMIKKATGSEEPKVGPSLEEVKKNIKQTDFPKEAEQKVVAIHLKHGGVIRAKLLEKSDNSYVIFWKGEKHTLMASQVDHVEYADRMTPEWKYKNDVVIVKNNGIVVDGEITDVDRDSVRVVFREGGGELEMGIPRKDIDHLLFAPVWNKEDNEILERLKKLFPQVEIYNEGNITLFTDSDIDRVRRFKKELNDVYTDIYFTFFRLFENRRPLNQNFVIVFDNRKDYLEIAYTDWAIGAAGYFMPPDKTLYLYNLWGSGIEKIYTDWETDLGKKWDEYDKGVTDSADKIVNEGITKELKGVISEYISVHRDIASSITSNVLRHEFTHEIFNNWGLQDVVLWKEDIDKDKLAEKKKEIIDALESNDEDKREKAFMEMTRMRLKEGEGYESNPANSWLAEGLAEYCGTMPMGSINEERLFYFQEMERKNEVNPIEFVMNFKCGSFHGLDWKAVLNAYAESWAFTHFLMTKYRDQFIEYIRLLIEIRSKRGEKAKTTDEVALLSKCIGKDLPTIDKEFREYIKAFPKVDDPEVKMFMRYQEVVNNWRQVWQRARGCFV